MRRVLSILLCLIVLSSIPTFALGREFALTVKPFNNIADVPNVYRIIIENYPVIEEVPYIIIIDEGTQNQVIRQGTLFGGYLNTVVPAFDKVGSPTFSLIIEEVSYYRKVSIAGLMEGSVGMDPIQYSNDIDFSVNKDPALEDGTPPPSPSAMPSTVEDLEEWLDSVSEQYPASEPSPVQPSPTKPPSTVLADASDVSIINKTVTIMMCLAGLILIIILWTRLNKKTKRNIISIFLVGILLTSFIPQSYAVSSVPVTTTAANLLGIALQIAKHERGTADWYPFALSSRVLSGTNTIRGVTINNGEGASNIAVTHKLLNYSGSQYGNYCYKLTGGIGIRFCASPRRDKSPGAAKDPALVTDLVLIWLAKGIMDAMNAGTKEDVAYLVFYMRLHLLRLDITGDGADLLDNADRYLAYVNGVPPTQLVEINEKTFGLTYTSFHTNDPGWKPFDFPYVLPETVVQPSKGMEGAKVNRDGRQYYVYRFDLSTDPMFKGREQRGWGNGPFVNATKSDREGRVVGPAWVGLDTGVTTNPDPRINTYVSGFFYYELVNTAHIPASAIKWGRTGAPRDLPDFAQPSSTKSEIVFVIDMTESSKWKDYVEGTVITGRVNAHGNPEIVPTTPGISSIWFCILYKVDAVNTELQDSALFTEIPLAFRLTLKLPPPTSITTTEVCDASDPETFYKLMTKPVITSEKTTLPDDTEGWVWYAKIGEDEIDNPPYFADGRNPITTENVQPPIYHGYQYDLYGGESCACKDPIPCGDCPKDPPCPSEDCSEGGFQTEEELRWYNLPTAYAEIKNGHSSSTVGDCDTTTGQFTLNRANEVYEVMMGVPETEKLYINGGGTEGFIDVRYKYVEAKYTFSVKWKVHWDCDGTEDATHLICSSDHLDEETGEYGSHNSSCYGAIAAHGGSSGVSTGDFCEAKTTSFSFLHFIEGTYRVPREMTVSNSRLLTSNYTIPMAGAITASHSLTPNASGLSSDDNVAPRSNASASNHNFGATGTWTLEVDFTGRHGWNEFTCETVNTGKMLESEAITRANAIVGTVFCQNDALTITIGGNDYRVVPKVNYKENSNPFGADAVLISAEKNTFQPIGTAWSMLDHIPIVGYTGVPEDGASRNSSGSIGNNQPWVRSAVPMISRLRNGLYSFDWGSNHASSYLTYPDSAARQIKPGRALAPLKTSKNQILDSEFRMDGALDVTDSTRYLAGSNQVRLEYTDWQNSDSGAYRGQKPTGLKTSETGGPPTYFGLNPVIVHNPTSTIYSWVGDIDESILADQRIDASKDYIQRHNDAIDSTAPTRVYIDYDFDVYIPNQGFMETYWNRLTTADHSLAGIVSADEISPGTRGKGYKGSPQAQTGIRSNSNPYTSTAWDLSKWLNAKYVMFNFDVFYYGASPNGCGTTVGAAGFRGGAASGFYAANTWIKLYDDGTNETCVDPDRFKFRVASHVKDMKEAWVRIVTENINAPSEILGNPAQGYVEAQVYINGDRDAYYLQGNSNGMNARATTRNSHALHVIGRIGNEIIDDSSDPSWASVFWNLTAEGKIDTSAGNKKFFGMYHNMFESIQPSNTSSHPHFFNRWRTLDKFHDASFSWNDQIKYPLPVMQSPLAEKNKQAQKIGYEEQASVQTLGNYGGAGATMWIYPRYYPIGNFTTGCPDTERFYLYAYDPFDSSRSLKEFYDSEWAFGKTYVPKYNYLLTHSLADTRAKLSAVETDVSIQPNYDAARKAGSNATVKVGQPHWIEVPTSLMTYIGGTRASGNVGQGKAYCEQITSNNSSAALTNAQRWHYRFSLPQTTQVIFHKNLSTGIFEGRTSDQYIYAEFTYRTKANNGLWDLTTFTNTGGDGSTANNSTSVALPNNAANLASSYSTAATVAAACSGLSITNRTGKNKIRSDETSKSALWNSTISRRQWIEPPTPEKVWDYSNPSSTDKTTVGTH